MDINRYSSLFDFFEKSCEKFNQRPVLTQMGTTLTYSELEERIRFFSAYLDQEMKLKPSDRVAIMFPNCFQFLIAFFAALRLGLVVVPINPLDTPRELSYQLKNSGAEAIVVLEPFLKTVQAVFDETQLKSVIVSDFGDEFPLFKRVLIGSILKLKSFFSKSNQLKLKDNQDFEKSVFSFKSALKKGRSLKSKKVDVDLDDLALLQYTGGTTGSPKGVMLTHRNMVSNVLQCVDWVRPVLSEGKERVVMALPLYHIFALTVCCLSFLSVGAMGILVADPRRLSDLIKIFDKEKPTVFVGVNTLFRALLRHSKFDQLDFSNLNLTISGGMKLQENIAQDWQEITGQIILEGYGLTEASPVVCVNPVNLKKFNGSIGLPMPLTEVSIRDEKGQELPLEEMGELWVKGPQVMRGYWDNPSETKGVLTEEGWLKTGDMGYIDKKAFVHLVDRKKELIIVSGFNVYPSEVESVLMSHPGVLEAAVVGVSDEEMGELVEAYIVKSDPKLDKKELIEFCKKNLLHYKVPKHIIFRDELPKSPVGKVLKRMLKS